LTISPVGDGFAVTPVVDYEPPRQDVRRDVLQCRPSSRAALRGRVHAPRRPYTGQPSRPPQAPTAQATPVGSAPMRQAAVFADAALRRVLEVIDRRRPTHAGTWPAGLGACHRPLRSRSRTPRRRRAAPDAAATGRAPRPRGRGQLLAHTAKEFRRKLLCPNDFRFRSGFHAGYRRFAVVCWGLRNFALGRSE